MFWLRSNLVCYRHRERLLKLGLKKFYNRQQFKEDEHKDKFLTSLSYDLQKKSSKPRDQLRVAQREVFCHMPLHFKATFKFRIN